MPRPIITFTTDFGEGSSYAAEMKAAALSVNREAVLVDITHSIPPQDVRRGALVLDAASRFFPEGSFHVAVVDPGVGGDRALIYARIGRQNYIAPDNGLLSLAARRTKPTQVISLTERRYWRPDVAPTFHGRDIMAPVAARLSLGEDPARLGSPHPNLVDLPWTAPRVEPRRVAGAVLLIDSFGNLISDIEAEHLAAAPAFESIAVVCRGRRIEGVVRTYADRPPGSLVALIGSSGRLEVARVQGSAAAELGARVGDPVAAAW